MFTMDFRLLHVVSQLKRANSLFPEAFALRVAVFSATDIPLLQQAPLWHSYLLNK